MKENILIVDESLGLGGVEKSLVNFLRNINYDLYNVDLILTSENPKILYKIPKEVKVLNWNSLNTIVNQYKEKSKIFAFSYLKYLILLNRVLNRCLRKNKLKIFERLLAKNLSQKNKNIKILFQNNTITKQYDYAISYSSFFQDYYVANTINAKKKIAFIHNNPKNNKLLKYNTDIYNKFDLICCVSTEIKNIFDNLFPSLISKTTVMYNIIDRNEIMKNALVGDKLNDDNNIKILSVGRISEEKGYDLSIEVANKLLQDNYKFKWYIVGDGYKKYKDYLVSKINKFNLNDNFILLGGTTNPYGYIKDCDIFVLASSIETYGISSAEAKIFNKPIVRTKTPGATEQFENGKNAILVDYNVDAVYNGILKYIKNKQFTNKIIRQLEHDNDQNIIEDPIKLIKEKINF